MKAERRSNFVIKYSINLGTSSHKDTGTLLLLLVNELTLYTTLNARIFVRSRSTYTPLVANVTLSKCGNIVTEKLDIALINGNILFSHKIPIYIQEDECCLVSALFRFVFCFFAKRSNWKDPSKSFIIGWDVFYRNINSLYTLIAYVNFW